MTKIRGVEINFNLEDISSQSQKNKIDTIIHFFSLYLKNRDEFYSLWVDEEPVVYLPFTTDDISVCRQSSLNGWKQVKSFWDPIFDMKGTFDWTINEIIISADGNTIITKSNSNINAQTTEAFNCVHLNYQGTYVQIFKFQNDKIKSFEEYYDTAFLNSQYSK